MPADVAIVVVTFNSAALISGLLDGLPAALDGLSAEVVVVDNGSDDGTADLVADRSDCRLVRSTNVGYAGGVNRGVRACARTDTILVLNPDLRLHAGAVPPLVRALHRPRTGVSAPRVLDGAGALSPSLRREPTLRRALGLGSLGIAALSEHVTEPAAYTRAGRVDWALGAALAVSRTCWEAVGEWDESFFLYSEETDFCLRARDLGFETWYEPAAVCQHIGGGSGRSDATHVMQVVNRVRLYARRHGPVAGSLYLLLSVLGEARWASRGHRPSRAAVRALVQPSRRPAELAAGRLVPR